jgi:hypothetical protein
VFAYKVKVLIALLPAVVLILVAGVAYATNNGASDTSTSGGQGSKGAGQPDSEEPSDTEDADEPDDVDGPGDTEATREPTCVPTTEPTLAGEPISYEGSPSLLGPAAALLVGSGVMTYAILQRRQ